jgi:hypothetical protein
MTKEEFDPYELEEIAVAMDRIMETHLSGYEISMFISHADAIELLDNYHEALDGDITGLNYCWEEFHKIVATLKGRVLEGDDDDE